MDGPRRLYKYQPPRKENIDSLCSGQIWFADPMRFNDPYDCAYEVDEPTLTEEDCVAILRNLDYRKSLTETQLADLAKPEKRKHIASGLKTVIAETLARKGVCSLAASHKDLLMWGHYADCHRGFCIEFDRSQDPFHLASTTALS